MKTLRCPKCGCTTSTVQKISDCSDCENNGSYTFPDYDQIWYFPFVTPSTQRDQVECDNWCDMGEAYGLGCVIFYCSDCDTVVDRIPFVEA